MSTISNSLSEESTRTKSPSILHAAGGNWCTINQFGVAGPDAVWTLVEASRLVPLLWPAEEEEVEVEGEEEEEELAIFYANAS